MKRFLMYCIAYGKYDISFMVEADNERQAIEKARQELAADGITDYENLCIQ